MTVVPKSSGLISSDSLSPVYATSIAPDCQSPIQRSNSIKESDLPVGPFPLDYDRGRFPFQRRRRGGTKSYPGRQSGTTASDMTTPLSPSIIQTCCNSASSRKEPIGNIGSLLPSPSPSIETRRPSCNIVDLEDEMAESTPVGAEIRTRLEELVAQHGGIDALEKKLQEVNDTSASSASNIIGSASNTNAERHNSVSVTANAERSGCLEEQSVPPQPVQARNRVIATSATQKRPSENVLEPRKRVQNTSETAATQDYQRRFSDNSVQDNSSSFVETEMRGFLERLTHRFAFLDSENRPANGIERPRLNLLREACERMDWFYLCLHQLYCLEHVRRSTGEAIPFRNETCRNGLSQLSYLLVRNDDLSGDAVRWFSEFPLPMDMLFPRSPIFRAAHEKVLVCLTKLAVNWAPFRDSCDIRGYPPLVDELTETFGAESFILQQVIFRAILRHVWKPPQDQCFQLVDNMFPRSYKEVLQRRSTNASNDETKAQKLAFVHAYQQYSQHHQQHTLFQQGHRMALSANNAELVHNHPNPRRASGTARSSGDPGPQAAHSDLLAYSMASSSPASTHPRRPIVPSVPHNQGVYQNLATREPSRSQRTSQSRTVSSQSTSRFPSELIEQTRQILPPNSVQARHTLPSNSHNINHIPLTSEQIDRSRPQPPLRVQTLPASIQQQSPLEIQRAPLESFHGYQTPVSNATQFIRADSNLSHSQPNPALMALHQAHLRSPILQSSTLHGFERPVLLRYIERVLLPPGELSSFKRHLSWDFHIDKETADKLVKDTPGSHGPPTRTLLPGSRLCRIRCIKINAGLPSQNEWVAAENVWPGSTAVILNDEALQMRKKSHHGKDLPIDATSFIKEGKNNISTAIIGLPENCTSRYAIGIEIIEVIEERAIKDQIRIIPYAEARQRIISQIRNIDPEVQVVDSRIILDLTDPFMARIFDVPLRGTSCRHNQCFDRDIFLQTRNSKNPKEPCPPDEFRCPICGLDARPQSLVIDGFFMSIREELHRKGRLDVKAVILHPSGEWEIKEEEEATGEQGDGSGVKGGQARRSVGRQSTPRDVIQLDD